MQYTSETMLIKSRDTGGTGVFASVTAKQAGWDYLNMAALRLNARIMADVFGWDPAVHGY